MKARSGMTDVLGYGRYATGEHGNILKEVCPQARTNTPQIGFYLLIPATTGKPGRFRGSLL
jgi:hypothetical protein